MYVVGNCVYRVFTFLLVYLHLGGLIMLPVKHGLPTVLNYISGFYITCNEIPDFINHADQDAILTRLAVFHTKCLPEEDSSVTCMHFPFLCKAENN